MLWYVNIKVEIDAESREEAQEAADRVARVMTYGSAHGVTNANADAVQVIAPATVANNDLDAVADGILGAVRGGR